MDWSSLSCLFLVPVDAAATGNITQKASPLQVRGSFLLEAITTNPHSKVYSTAMRNPSPVTWGRKRCRAVLQSDIEWVGSVSRALSFAERMLSSCSWSKGKWGDKEQLASPIGSLLDSKGTDSVEALSTPAVADVECERWDSRLIGCFR
ncbi:hypothetical protein ACFE04_019735 [Oxalis oulophora]